MMRIRAFTSAEAPAAITIPANTQMLVVEDGFVTTPASCSTIVHVQRGATLVYSWNVFSSDDHLRSVTVDLEEGARASFYGVVVGRNKDRVQLRLFQNHHAPSVSRANIRCIAAERANVEVSGRISIQQDAHGADAYLESRSMVLTKDARSAMIPSLEILARDVRAKHAAASGPMDPEQVFYLTSRGIEEATAKKLVLAGFLNAVLDQLPRAAQQAIVQERWNELLKKVT